MNTRISTCRYEKQAWQMGTRHGMVRRTEKNQKPAKPKIKTGANVLASHCYAPKLCAPNSPISLHVIARATTSIRCCISKRGRVRPSNGLTVGPSVHRSVRRSVTPSLRRLLGASYAQYSALFPKHATLSLRC